MPTPINPKSGTVSKTTGPDESKVGATPIKKETGFVSKPTSPARPVKYGLPQVPKSNT